jgi:hypothetical protein
MKKILSLALLILGIGSCTEIVEVEVAPSPTSMTVYNHSKDTVLVYLTLGTTQGCIQNVNEVSWVQDTVQGQRGLQGTFLLMPGDSTDSFNGDGLGFNGVLSFNFAPDNCPSPSYTNGINQFEFIINNSFQAGNPQETIDISCVHGVNGVIRVNLSDSNWNAGPTIPMIQSFANTMDKSFIGAAGVFPFGCTHCTDYIGAPSCIPLPQPVQKAAICNVQRNANQGGGRIQVIYLGAVNILK